MQGSGVGGSSQGRKSTDLIKVATRERWRVREREREVVHSRSQSPGFYNKLSSLWRSSCRRGCNVWSQIMADTDKSFRSTRLWISVKATTTVPCTDTGTCASCQLENGSIFVPSRWALKELLKTEAVFFFLQCVQFCASFWEDQPWTELCKWPLRCYRVLAFRPRTQALCFWPKGKREDKVFLVLNTSPFTSYYCNSTCFELAQHRVIYSESREHKNEQREKILILNTFKFKNTRARNTFIWSVCAWTTFMNYVTQVTLEMHEFHASVK